MMPRTAVKPTFSAVLRPETRTRPTESQRTDTGEDLANLRASGPQTNSRAVTDMSG